MKKLNLKNSLAKIQKFNIWYELIILVGLLSTVLIAVYFFRTVTFAENTYPSLPAENTVVAFEWLGDLNNSEVADLSKNIGLPSTVEFLELEQYWFQDLEFLQQAINLRLSTKVIGLLKIDSKIQPVLIYNFKSKAVPSFDPSFFEGFSYRVEPGRLLVAKSSQGLNLLQDVKKPILSLHRFQDAYRNIPQQSILQFYLNHELLDSSTLRNNLAFFTEINSRFGVTVGSLNATSNAVALSTYTNENSQTNFGFPVTRDKFNPTIPNLLPENIQFYLGGNQAFFRLTNLLKYYPKYQKQDSLVATDILNLLNSYNLSTDFIEILKQALSTEFAFTIDDNNRKSFIFKTPNNENTDKLKQQLNNLVAFANPKVIPIVLQDGQATRNLAPDPKQKLEEVDDKAFKADLTSLDLELFWGSVNNKFDYISETLNPTIFLSLTGQTFQEARFYQEAIEMLLPIADELIVAKREFLYTYLADYLDRSDIPNIVTATNYFNDGIQTVTILSW